MHREHGQIKSGRCARLDSTHTQKRIFIIGLNQDLLMCKETGNHAHSLLLFISAAYGTV